MFDVAENDCRQAPSGNTTQMKRLSAQSPELELITTAVCWAAARASESEEEEGEQGKDG